MEELVEEILVVEEDDGWGTIITIITTRTTSTFSPPPGVGNFRFSTFALCLLRDVEKETHKHEVLWEKHIFSDIRFLQCAEFAKTLGFFSIWS